MKLPIAHYREIIRLGAPVLVTQLGVITVSFADTMMVGAYGTESLGAAAFVNALFLVVIVMLMGFANGTTPLIGALYGRRCHAEAGRLMRTALGVNLRLSIAFTIIMAMVHALTGYMNQPTELLPLIKSYYWFVLLGLIPQSVFGVCQQTMNGTNDTATPMWIILGANALNILGNWLLIFGKFGLPEMGVNGAGLSTLIARSAAAVAILTVFCRQRRYRPYLEGFRGQLSSLRLRSQQRLIWRTSYPVMIQSGVECAMWSFGAIVCGWFGTIQLASYQVITTISQLGFMIFMSVGVAIAVRVSNYAGVRDTANVRATAGAGMHLNLVLATLAMVVFFCAGPWLVGMFSDETAVIEHAVLLIPPLVLYQYGDAIQLTYCNALRGTANVRPMLWISVVSYILVGIPVLLLFACTLDWRNIGVYYSFSVALFVAAALYIVAFRRTLRQWS